MSITHSGKNSTVLWRQNHDQVNKIKMKWNKHLNENSVILELER